MKPAMAIIGIALLAITLNKARIEPQKEINVDRIYDYHIDKTLLENEIESLQGHIEKMETENSTLKDRITTMQKQVKTNVNRGKFQGRKYRTEKLTVTAYAPFDNKSGMCSDGSPTKTATGTYPKHGTVAVNPKRFPYGTEFYIEGYGYGKALDTGGAMRKNSSKIDIFMQTHKNAIEWGKRDVEVIIFED